VVAYYLDLAYKDYVASRVLLNSGLLLLGAILASTAVEKCFKAVLAFRGNDSRGHLKTAHINAAVAFHPGLNARLNRDFLTLLKRVYRVRYYDDAKLEDGFNFVIADREFIAELDLVSMTILHGFALRHSEGKHRSAYESARSSRDPRLWDNNHLLPDSDKAEFVSSMPQTVYEFRHRKGWLPIEITYRAYPVASDGKFLREALIPQGVQGNQYKVSFKPMPPDTRLLLPGSLVLTPEP
jgi:hypothetical protein